MFLSTCPCFTLLLFTSYLAAQNPTHASSDEFSLGCGGGHSDRWFDATSEVTNFFEFGWRYTHKFESPFRVGLALSISKGFFVVGPIYIWPDLAIDFQYFSVGTTGVRLGSRDFLYGEISLLDEIPLLSGKGLLRIGGGWKIPNWDTRIWLGMNRYPFRDYGWATQIDFPLSSGEYLFLNGRIGQSRRSKSEYGASIGIRTVVH